MSVYIKTDRVRRAYWAILKSCIKNMKGYSELEKIFDKKFLNYIISRSKALSAGNSTLEYDDLVQDGLTKLCVLQTKVPKLNDPIIMKSLVNMYNSIHKARKDSPVIVSWEEYI